MFSSPRHLIGRILSAFGSRKDLVLEDLALRQQLLAFHTKRPRAEASGETPRIHGELLKLGLKISEPGCRDDCSETWLTHAAMFAAPVAQSWSNTRLGR